MVSFKIMKKLLSSALALVFLSSCSYTLKPEMGEKEIEYFVDGLRIKGMLFLPMSGPMSGSGGKYPAVIVNHGGWDGINGDIILLCRFLRDKGFVVIASQYRGEGGSEGKTTGLFDRGRIRDSLALIDYLKELDYVDMKNLFMVGHSIGGFVTYGASIETTEIKAFVAMSGVFTPLLCKLEHVRGPVLIIHGSADKRVLLYDSECAAERLKATGQRYELKVYEGAGHHIFSRGMRDRTYGDILDWIEGFRD